MRKIMRYLLILVFITFVVIQFIRPEKNNSGYQSVAAFENETNPSQEVMGILKNNCYDCHSDQTQYPWYFEIAPISYWMAGHIKHAKGEFNVSAWDSYSTKKKDHKLEELVEKVEKKEMPLDSYTWIHGDLSEEDRKTLLLWANLARLRYVEELKVSSK